MMVRIYRVKKTDLFLNVTYPVRHDIGDPASEANFVIN